MKVVINKIFKDELRNRKLPITKVKVDQDAKELEGVKTKGLITSQKIRTYISNTYKK